MIGHISIVVMGSLALVIAGCGDSPARSECGDRGTEHHVGLATYCVYDEAAVAASGGRFTCPSAAPVRIDVGGAIVCTSDSAIDGPDDVPASVCVGLADVCGRAATSDAGDVDDASAPPMDAGDDDAGATPPPPPIDAGPTEDSGLGGCPPIDARDEVDVGGELTVDATWSCDRLYRVRETLFVMGGATLTIQPGTRVIADSGAAIIVMNDGRIDAVGTASAPIVMTSSATVGTRRAGQWLGVVLLGLAPLSTGGGVRRFVDDPRLPFGGDVEAHDCGRLRYVRIEFAGNSIGRPGLAVEACGSRTQIDHVQVHVSAANGIDVEGGNVDMSHVVVSSSLESGIAWDRGWSGRVQFLIVQSLAGAADRALIHAESHDSPRARPHIENATLVSVGPGRHRVGLFFDNGTDGILRNAIVWGAFDAAFDIVDVDQVNRVRASPGSLDVSHTMFFGMGEDAAGYITRESAPPDYPGDGTFDDVAWISDPTRENRFGVDPLLPRADSVFAPMLAPVLGSPAGRGAIAAPDDGFFDTSATYAGAIEPGGADWTAGWTAFPGS